MTKSELPSSTQLGDSQSAVNQMNDTNSTFAQTPGGVDDEDEDEDEDEEDKDDNDKPKDE